MSAIASQALEKSFDWIGIVVIPAGMTIFLGGWVGLVCTRLMIFYQARYKAATDIYGALPELKAAETPSGMVYVMGTVLNPAMQEFAALGHRTAAKEINLIGRRCYEKAAELLGVEVREGRPPELPNLPPADFVKFRSEFISGFYLRHMNNASKRISRFRPNVWALLNPNPLPTYEHASEIARTI